MCKTCRPTRCADDVTQTLTADVSLSRAVRVCSKHFFWKIRKQNSFFFKLSIIELIIFSKNFSLSIACLLSMSKPSQPSYGRFRARNLKALDGEHNSSGIIFCNIELFTGFLNLWISQKFESFCSIKTLLIEQTDLNLWKRALQSRVCGSSAFAIGSSLGEMQTFIILQNEQNLQETLLKRVPLKQRLWIFYFKGNSSTETSPKGALNKVSKSEGPRPLYQ